MTDAAGAGRRYAIPRILRMTAAAAVVAAGSELLAADDWIEVKTAHFTVMSNAGQSSSRTLAWQLEQVRRATTMLFQWVNADFDRPLLVLAPKDESSMKSLAPEYWERKGGVRPVSVWVSGADQHYLAIRTDVQAEDLFDLNPHIHAYFSYASLTLRQSADGALPLWFLRGFAGVLSNTIVRNGHVVFGHTIPWHLDRLRDSSRLKLSDLTRVATTARMNNESLSQFDAQSWAFVHFLLFSDDGARRPRLDLYVALLAKGTNSNAALTEAFGNVDALTADFVRYINRQLFTYLRFKVDATVSREGFSSRSLPAFESASARALFHGAMGRNAEARRAIDEARKARQDAPEAFAAEAILLDREGNAAEARAAFTQAVNAGSTSSYAHYRLATLMWTPEPPTETLRTIEKLLLRAVTLNNRDARSYAYLGNVRSLTGGEGLPFARRAIALDPSDPSYRLFAARILLRRKAFDEALTDARAALALARDNDERRSANALIESIERAKSGGSILPDL